MSETRRGEDNREFQRLLKTAEKKLKAAGIDSAAAEVELILEYLLDVERVQVYLHGAKLLDEEKLRRFHQIIERRATRYPLQYILEESWFYGRKFFVSPAVMVPTPETELLCDLAINYIRNEGLQAPSILDVGAGSGVICVTVAAELPDAKIKAVDLSPDALAIAQRNAQDLGQSGRIEFLQSDGFSSLPRDDRFDLILSNPPYISDDEYKALPLEVLADPKLSLVSGAEGLDFIAVLINDAPRFLKDKGRLMFEIGYNQADRVSAMTEKNNRYRSISIMKDLNDIDRVVILSV